MEQAIHETDFISVFIAVIQACDYHVDFLSGLTHNIQLRIHA
jgi:hypothetical protein